MLLYTYTACPLVVYFHPKLGSTIGLFLSALTTILRAFLIFPMRATCPVYLSLVHSISLVIYDERYEHCCSSLCTNSAAPHYVRTVLLLITYEHCCSSLCTNTAAPHYVRTTPLLILYEQCCSSLRNFLSNSRCSFSLSGVNIAVGTLLLNT